MSLNDFKAQRAALLAQIAENSRHLLRSDKDNSRLAKLRASLNAIEIVFDAVNPPTTCPICGETILASRDGECVNAGTWRHV